jgi:hypothetical protein
VSETNRIIAAQAAEIERLTKERDEAVSRVSVMRCLLREAVEYVVEARDRIVNHPANASRIAVEQKFIDEINKALDFENGDENDC